MRKSIVIALTLILSANVFAQEKEKRIHIGVKMGYVSTKLTPSYTDNNGIKYTYTAVGGVTVGGFIQMTISNKILFQPEFLMVWKGTKHSGYNNYDRITYLEFPINLLAKLPVKSSFIFIGGGPAPAFRITPDYGSYNGIAAFDLGVNFLAGIQFPLGFSMQMNFTKGLLGVYKQNLQKLTNTALGLSIGYTF